MTVQPMLATPAAVDGCPNWCDGKHSKTEKGVYHYTEIGRLDSGELTLVVAVAHWVTTDDPDSSPVIVFDWEGSAEDDDGVYLLEGIEIDQADGEALIPLLVQANTILRTGRRA